MTSRIILYGMTILLCLYVGLNAGYQLHEKEHTDYIKKLKEVNTHLRMRIDTLLTVKGAIYD